MPRHPPNALTRLIRSPSAAHREQTPRARQPSLASTTQHSFYPPGHPPAPPRASQTPIPGAKPMTRPPPQTASRIPIHNVKDQRTEITGRRTEEYPTAPRPRPNSHSLGPRRTETREHRRRAEGTALLLFSDLGALSSCLPAPGGADRDRTGDLLLAKQALSQLSYTPVPGTSSQEPETSDPLAPGS